MTLTTTQIAQMIDLSCVRTTSTRQDIEEMVAAAKRYGFGQVSVMQCFVPYTRSLLGNQTSTRLIGNVSFPSGSDSTELKVAQAKMLVAAGCDEIDMVMNIGQLLSGMSDDVAADVKAVVDTVKPLPIKVIIEIMYLNDSQVRQACNICIDAGASFVKTGTGWADRGTTLEDVQQVKSIVGEKIQIKASGGIRNLDTLQAMYDAGARRFGINLLSGIAILQASGNNQ